jgi:hypothetical protein
MVAEESLLTVDEVNQRLPLVRSIVKDIVDLHSDISQRQQRLRSLRERHPASTSADSVYEQEVKQMEEELLRDEARLDVFSHELHQIGGMLTDAASGRVDFPGDLSGERVFFCWKNGESEVLFWHSGECDGSNRVSLYHEMGSGDFSGDSGLHRDSK